MTSTIEIDDLKQAWQTLSTRLEQQSAVQLELLQLARVDKLKSSLRPLFWGQLMQLLFGFAMILAGVWLWTTFSTLTPVLVMGIIMHLYGVATIITSCIVMARITLIDRSLPVLELQQRLLHLRKASIVSSAVAGLPWWLLWMLPPAVLIGIAQDSGQGLPLGVWSWFAFGGVGLLGTWCFHRWSQRPGREDLAKRLHDLAAGNSLRKAQAELDALKAFAQE